MNLPSWTSEQLKNFIRREQQRLDYWDKFEELSNPEELATAKENLRALLTVINHPSGEKIFDQLARCSTRFSLLTKIDVTEFSKELDRIEKETGKATRKKPTGKGYTLRGMGQEDAATSIYYSLMDNPPPTSKELETWEDRLEESLSAVISLLTNAPEVKIHVNYFSSALAWSVIKAQKELLAKDIIELIDLYNVDLDDKNDLIGRIKYEGRHYTGDYIDMPLGYPSLIDLLRKLLESGEIRKGQGVLGKTKGKYAKRTHFIRTFAAKNSLKKPSNELIAEIASIIFAPIDAPGVSRILTKWKQAPKY